MTFYRFAILTYLDPGGMINASADESGRPGDWSRVLPGADKIVSVCPLPAEMPGFPEAFRLLITYKAKA